MRVPNRTWVARGLLALLVAVGANVVLSVLSLEHDAPLVALLSLATVAAVVLTLVTLDTATRSDWTVRRSDARRDSGEDTRTAMYRHVVEAHFASMDGDDAIVWQIAALARQRLRQLHGLRYDESPERVTELLGPALAEWVSHDRRHRYQPDARHRRYSVAQLGEAVRRIEEL